VKTKLTLLALAAAVVAWTGCSGGGGGSGEAKRLNGEGSSFVYPLMTKWASEYEKAKGVQVNYNQTGSGAGIQQMISKTEDFGCSDAPLNDDELNKARAAGGEVVHIPLAMGAVVPIYNLPEVKKPLRFNGQVLAAIFLEKIKKWNDPALAKLNPGVDLPPTDILTVHRSDGSGTTYVFTDYLSKVSPDDWKPQVGRSTSVKWPGGVAAKGNPGVAGKVAQSPGSIGYVELIYALQSKIAFGFVQNKEGEFPEPGLESVTAAAKGALANIPDDLRYSITNAPGKESYPISGTVWAVLYVNQPADKGPALVEFLRWVTHDGQQYTKDLQYARLPDELVKRIDDKLALIKSGK
jgi:phosphate transport system substrate-binding protein